MGKFIHGVDIGGTTVKMGLFNENGELIQKWEIPTIKDNGGSQILPDIAGAIKAKNELLGIQMSDVLGVGLGIPGPITSDGRVLKCANLGWGIFSVADEVRKLTGIQKVCIGNDANVAALGEQWRGGGRGFDNIVMVTLGTGVGAGIIIGGKIITGSNGAAGEIGHIPVNTNETRTCGCGKKGCLEQYTSATGLMSDARLAIENNDRPSKMREYKQLTGKEIFDAFKAGDEVASEVVNKYADYLGRGLAITAQVIDPQAFVLGGGVAKNGEIVAQIVKENYEKYVMFALKDKVFRLAELGNDAGIYGAARMVMIDD